MKRRNTKAITQIQAIIIVIIVIVAAAAAAWYYTRPTIPTAPDEILIGFVTSFTGPMGAGGFATQWVVEKAIDDINAEGGVYVEEYKTEIPLNVIFGDAESDPAAASAVTSKLVLSDQVHVLITSAPPPLALPVASIGEKNGIPTLLQTPLEPFMGAGPWTTVWNAMFLIEDALAEWLALTQEYADQTNKVVAIAIEGDVDGTVWYDLIPPKLTEGGLTPLELGTFPPGTADFTILIQEWLNQDAEILWANCMPPTFVGLWRQCVEQGFVPKLAIVGRAMLGPANAEALGGNLANGICTEIWWHPDFPWSTPPYPGGQTLREMYETARELPWTMGVGPNYGQIQIVADAIEQAGTLDPSDLAEAIGTSTFLTPMGRLDFDPTTHVARFPVIMGQWQEGIEYPWNLALVFSRHPDVTATGEVVFPLPPPT